MSSLSVPVFPVMECAELVRGVPFASEANKVLDGKDVEVTAVQKVSVLYVGTKKSEAT